MVIVNSLTYGLKAFLLPTNSFYIDLEQREKGFRYCKQTYSCCSRCEKVVGKFLPPPSSPIPSTGLVLASQSS